MDDRTAEIREALANPGRFAMAPAVIWKAAKEWADLLDSDALIIRRDENGKWLLPGGKRGWDTLYWQGVVSDLFDSLASSQGVEHG